MPHGGKGAAVRAGMLAARGDLVVFADADMATPPDELVLLVDALERRGRRIRQPDPAGRQRHAQVAAGLAAGARQDVPPAGLRLGGGPDPGHAVRVQGLPPGGGPGRLRAPAGHQHRLRRGGHLPGPAARLPARRGAHPLGGPSRLPDAPGTAPGRSAWRGTCSGSRCSTGTSGASCGRRPISRPAEPRTAAPRRRPRAAAARSSRSRVFVLATAATLAVAGDTLGYDFLAYHNAASRAAGRAARVRHLLPRRGPVRALLLPADVPPAGPPVRPAAGRRRRPGSGSGCCSRPSGPAWPSCRSAARTRWLIVLLAGLSWPFLYNVKLGQVGPLLFLAVRRRLAQPGSAGDPGSHGGDRRGDQDPARARARLGAAHPALGGRRRRRRGRLVGAGGWRPR